MTENSLKRVFLITNGCPENRIDLALIQRFFEANRWTVVPSYLDADLIVFNACGLTQFHENSSQNIIEDKKSVFCCAGRMSSRAAILPHPLVGNDKTQYSGMSS